MNLRLCAAVDLGLVLTRFYSGIYLFIVFVSSFIFLLVFIVGLSGYWLWFQHGRRQDCLPICLEMQSSRHMYKIASLPEHSDEPILATGAAVLFECL